MNGTELYVTYWMAGIFGIAVLYLTNFVAGWTTGGTMSDPAPVPQYG